MGMEFEHVGLRAPVLSGIHMSTIFCYGIMWNVTMKLEFCGYFCFLASC